MSNIENSVVQYIGNGKVYLIAGGSKIYTDIAARFVKSERSVEDIISSPYDQKIVNNILNSGHSAALEFDYFLFGVEGYSRVTETQLVRKRIASYLIKSGRAELSGKRSHKYILPYSICNSICTFTIKDTDGIPHQCDLSAMDLVHMCSHFYDIGVQAGLKEEDLRYIKPQATEFKAIIGMNARALRDFFAVRCCNNAQAEIRDLAMKMLRLCKDTTPDLFKDAGPNCKVHGYCPEGQYQCEQYKGHIPTKEQMLYCWKTHHKESIHD